MLISTSKSELKKYKVSALWGDHEAKKNERANALKEVKRLCKEFGFTASILKGSPAKGRKKK